MAKSKEQELRRQLEILKAQLKSDQGTTRTEKPYDVLEVTQPQAPQTTKIQSHTLDYAEIKKDLIKTLVFAAIGILLVVTLSFTENQWLALIKFL